MYFMRIGRQEVVSRSGEREDVLLHARCTHGATPTLLYRRPRVSEQESLDDPMCAPQPQGSYPFLSFAIKILKSLAYASGRRTPPATSTLTQIQPGPPRPHHSRHPLQKVNYVVKGGPLYKPGEVVPGQASVVARFLRTGYLWDTVRVMGGAYGGFTKFNPVSGLFSCLSYRDPNLGKTLDNYDGCSGTGCCVVLCGVVSWRCVACGARAQYSVWCAHPCMYACQHNIGFGVISLSSPCRPSGSG